MLSKQRIITAIVVAACCFLGRVTSFSTGISTYRWTRWSTSTFPTIQHRSIMYPNLICSLSSVGLNAETSEAKIEKTMRSQLRAITGFSLTAVRATMRAATGISLTAIYISALAISGFWIRQTMRVVLDIFPTWARYFVQPILILYYAPLFILRNMTAPKRREQEKVHDTLVESWKQAVAVAEHSTSYWPIHLSENGDLEPMEDELDINDVVAKSVEMASKIANDT